MSLDHQIGEKLRLARTAANVSLADAAAVLDLTESELSAAEQGTRRTDARLLQCAARAYGVEIRWFFNSSKDVRVSDEEKVLTRATSISILQSFRSHETLSQLCETVRESDYSGRPRKNVA
jgi:transcriptional regulator with XRE-family HTH domain